MLKQCRFLDLIPCAAAHSEALRSACLWLTRNHKEARRQLCADAQVLQLGCIAEWGMTGPCHVCDCTPAHTQHCLPVKCCPECRLDCAAFEKLKREAEAEDAKKAALWEEVSYFPLT